MYDKVTERDIKKKTATYNVIYIGAYDRPRKRVQFILKFMNLKESSEFHYMFAGPIKEDFVADLQNVRSKNYMIYGKVDEKTKMKLFKKASFLYFPSKLEGTGMPITESFKLGVIPIVHKDSKIPDIVKSQCVVVKGPKGALRKMQELSNDPEKFTATLTDNYEYSRLFDYNNYVAFLMGFYA